jgi:hypothetical protein
MVGESKTNRIERLVDSHWLRKTTCGLIIGNLALAAGSLYVHDIDSSQAATAANEAQAPETVTTTNSQLLLETVNEPKPMVRRVLKELPPGLKPVHDPEAINLPEQTMLTADGECTVQFGIEHTSPNDLMVTTYLFGPIYAMTDRDLYERDGTSNSPTRHAEGHYATGVTLPSSDSGQINEFLADTTQFFCNNIN